ncbi:MAG TPA: DUF6075 family protein [Ktedonobacteraceae bacterium]|nr:DUF6075 family protein [Ktedonobacteraceae bacterium]
MNIFFTSPDHKKRWLTAILTIGKVYDGKLDPEYASALYILTSRNETWQQASAYVDRDGIEFEALFAAAHFSGAYSALVRLAGNLFNGQTECSPVELYRLDESNFTIALTAFQIRRVSLPINEIASKAELYNIEMDIRNRISAENRPKPWLPLIDGE